jgi:signal transduction histidine kinase/ligand-binding sensor domain-containing protein/CheY-like chemotaxis protein/AraC-like DNA-binding protein
MRLKINLIVTLCFIAIYSGLAQNNQYQFSRLDIASGLSNNQVNCIYKDSRGFMWFGTSSGLNRYDGYKFKIFKSDSQDTTTLSDDFIRDIFEGPDHKLWIRTKNGYNYNIYDPLTEHFNRSPQSYLKSIGLPDALITSIKKDEHGNFWFLYANMGIYLYNPTNKQVRHFYNNGKSQESLYSNDVTAIALNSVGKAWLVYRDGTFDLLDPTLNRVVYRSTLLKNANRAKPVYYLLSVDNENDLWFYSYAPAVGVYFFSPERNTLMPVDKGTHGSSLKSNIVFNIVQDNKGEIWIATDHGGINLVSKKDFKVSYLLSREDDNKSIGQNSIISLYKDNTGIMWAGTYKKGISYYHEDILKFPLFRHYSSDPKSLSFNDVNRFVEDAAGNLWMGTNGGGLIYFNRKTGTYTDYLHNPKNANSLASDVIVGLCIDHEQKLWIGTYWGGLDCFDGHTFKHYRHDDKDPGSISDDRVWEIIEDSSNRLWVGTLAGGLNRFDRDKQLFYHYGPEQKNSVSSGYIPTIFEDANKNIWIGGYAGIDVLSSKTGKFSNYKHSNKDSNSLIHNNINSITEDSRKLMWIGTREGLSVFDAKSGNFLNFRKENGLPDNAILDAIEDDNHTMWISTPNGLCNVTVKSTATGYFFQFKNFDEADGLQGREFNENAAYKTREGDLVFGGANGFNLFKPSNIHINKNKINLAFTDLQVFNKSVSANEHFNNHVILDRSITETKAFKLHYSENEFSIEFAPLNFFNADKFSLQYIMEGFDKRWLNADNKLRRATYTNLDPGEYTFRVRASNPEAPNNSESIYLKIEILPPFWRSTIAYIFYILLFLVLLFYIRYRGIKKIEAKFAIEEERKDTKRIIETERQDAQRMHELDLMKIKFLTNVSHEFRTPLSLIMAPVDKILNKTESPEQKFQLQIIKRNARRLLNLVNQLLDFRKLENHELKLHTTTADIVGFIKDISTSFTDIAENRKIGFVFDTDIEKIETRFDRDKIERILFNLLSNAFKFTPAGGHVSVILSLIGSYDPESRIQIFEIKVIDTGIGIPTEKLDKVFDRFFQNDVPGSMLNQGSGIGLSIVKEFVKMHGGEISVESALDQGSCFIVRLPLILGKHAFDTGISAEDKSLNTEDKKTKRDIKKPTVLIVEDNDDFRFYLKDNLKESFHILEAVNGKEGWQKALALHPDLMVSDINMPEMSGTELCLKIKNDIRTSHIPVILLTALSGETELIRGLETGANDYLNKPFNFEVLSSKIRNLLTLQDNFKKTYTKHVNVNLPDIANQSDDEKFIGNMLDYIERNILNPNLSVEEVSKQMCMSRVSLYKKVLMITGKSPVEFIRSFRLKKAAQLFEKTQLNIAEVSYEVGFNTPNYFAKSFKVEYNILPSEYIANVRKKNSGEDLTA